MMEETTEYEAEPLEAEAEDAVEDESALEGEEEVEIDAALNTALPMSERRTAFKNAIELCVQRQMKGGYGKEEKEEGGDMFSSLLGEG